MLTTAHYATITCLRPRRLLLIRLALYILDIRCGDTRRAPLPTFTISPSRRNRPFGQQLARRLLSIARIAKARIDVRAS